MKRRKKKTAHRLRGDYMNYGQLIVTITIKNWSGEKQDKFVANQTDKAELRRIASILKDKYDIDLSTEKDFFGV